MKKACVTFLILALAILTSAASSQTPATQSQQNPPSRRTTPSGEQSVKDQGKDQEVIRLGVTLVQVDVVVVDAKNQQITDLKPEDFEILEDGQPQRISNFSYITLPTRTHEKAEIRTEKEAPTLPARLRIHSVRGRSRTKFAPPAMTKMAAKTMASPLRAMAIHCQLKSSLRSAVRKAMPANAAAPRSIHRYGRSEACMEGSKAGRAKAGPTIMVDRRLRA